MYTKNKRNYLENQEKSKKSPQVNENKGKLYNKCLRWSDSKKKLFNKLVELDNKYMHVRPKQETLAQWVGIVRETTNKILASLKEEGAIGSMRRPWTSCKYTIADIFHDPVIRKELKAIFPALGILSIAMLSSFAIQNSCQSEYVTQYIRENKNYFIYSSKNSLGYYQYTNCKSDSLPKSKHREIDYQNIVKNLQTETRRYMNEAQFEFLKTIPGMNSAARSQLSVFPLIVLKEAFKILQKRSGIGNSFHYYQGICRSLCLKNSIKLPIIPETAQRPFFDWKSPQQTQLAEPKVVVLANKPIIPQETPQQRTDRKCAEAFQQYLARRKKEKEALEISIATSEKKLDDKDVVPT